MLPEHCSAYTSQTCKRDDCSVLPYLPGQSEPHARRSLQELTESLLKNEPARVHDGRMFVHVNAQAPYAAGFRFLSQEAWRKLVPVLSASGCVSCTSSFLTRRATAGALISAVTFPCLESVQKSHRY
eukprot:6197302-Pleurochrysis_carterae.AAC.1